MNTNGDLKYNFYPHTLEEIKIDYNKKLYLQKLSNNVLEKRLTKLLDNVSVFDWDGYFYFNLKYDDVGLRTIYTIFECQSRDIGINDIIKNRINYYNDRINSIDFSKIKHYSNIIYNDNCLFKYMSKKHLDFWLNNNIRYSNSCNYKKNNSFEHLQDDENTMIYKNPNSFIVDDNGYKTKIHKITETVDTYFIMSFSLEFNLKLFIFFNYNACFIIKNRDNFVNRLFNDFSRNMERPYVNFDKIHYVDNDIECEMNNNVMFEKNYYYRYENEYRGILLYNKQIEVINKMSSLCFHVDDFDIEKDCIILDE